MKRGFGLFLLAGLPVLASQPQFPSYFAENRGQAPADVKFTMRRPNGTAFFSTRGVALALQRSSLDVRFVGSAANPVVEGRQKLKAVANFFEGNDSSRWRSDVALFEKLVYRELWPGIDMVYSTSTQAFKSEFRVAPGAAPDRIAWSYGSQAGVSVDSDGALAVRSGGETVREAAPEIYQQIGGIKKPVAGAYRVSGKGVVSFELGEYDRTAELVIDPVIVFSSLLGGTSQDQASAIATDSFGNIVVAGWTSSASFPAMAVSKQPQFGGSVDAFVAKFGGNGSYLIFCTFLGGSGDDRAMGVAVDGPGNIYLTGRTASSNFPVALALQPHLSGSADAFVTKLNPAGTQLLYSTYFGGSNVESGNAIAVDSYGEAYMAGDTSSTNLPVLNGVYRTNQGGQDGFVTKFTATGTAIISSTYLGGAATDHITAIAVNAAGYPFVTGSTFSTNFPVNHAVQPATGGNEDAFVTELLPGGNALVFSTYLGGSSGTAGLPEEGRAIAVDASGNIYVAGTTSSLNFPVTSSALQGAFAGGNQDGFLTQYSPGGLRINYSSYIGGSGLDLVNGIAMDSFGYVTVAGETSSFDFPNTRGVQKQLNGSYDGFVTKYFFRGTTCSLINSSYLGGTGSDTIAGIALDRGGNALVAGFTSSIDFPASPRAYQSSNLGSTNAIVAKIANPFFPAVYNQVSAGPLVNLDSGHDSLYDGESFTGASIYWGNPGDIIILGDWNHSGTVKVGAFRNGLWILDSNGNGVLDGGDLQFTFGQAGDIPVVGDWDGTGTLKAGLFRGGTWILDFSGHLQGVPTGNSDKTVTYGLGTDIPVVGDWTGTGTTRIGVFRNGFWLLDANGDYVLNGLDPFFVFGQAGDTPLTGDWDGSGVTHPGIVRNNRWYLNYQWNFETGGIGSAGTELNFTFGSAGSIPLAGKNFN